MIERQLRVWLGRFGGELAQQQVSPGVVAVGPEIDLQEPDRLRKPPRRARSRIDSRLGPGFSARNTPSAAAADNPSTAPVRSTSSRIGRRVCDPAERMVPMACSWPVLVASREDGLRHRRSSRASIQHNPDGRSLPILLPGDARAGRPSVLAAPPGGWESKRVTGPTGCEGREAEAAVSQLLDCLPDAIRLRGLAELAIEQGQAV